jgi:prepilin-type N-terminal cleavage/methylation domain-containing protein
MGRMPTAQHGQDARATSDRGDGEARVARRGFTMLEVLVSLAIIGLIASILISGSAALLRDKPVAVRDVFWQAVQEARKTALVNNREVRLRFFDEREKGKGFEILDGSSTQSFPLLPEVAPPELKVDFVTVQKGGNVILVAGVMIETATVPYVSFFPDGTCSAFRLQIVRSGGTEHLTIDPWTCAEVLPRDPNAPLI